ncbi:MAG: hypothetical protein WA988_17175, partial [Candidatus Nanopelagicales bacterium]
ASASPEYRSLEEQAPNGNRAIPVRALMELLRQAGISSDDLKIEVARSRERLSESLSAAMSHTPFDAGRSR